MIEFQYAVIHNFLSIQTGTVHLADQGLVLIEGVNEDDPSALSNGAGKSSIVDAISWCLYGVTARGMTGDAVVNVKAGKNTSVHISLVVDGEKYSIVRHRKHAKGKNRVELYRFDPATGTVDLTLGTDRLTQDRINNLLGCDAQVFNAAIYMGQESMPDLPSMTDKTLKAILEQAMGLDKLDAAMEVVAEQTKTLEWDLSDKRMQERSIMADQIVIEDNIKSLQASIDIYEGDFRSITEQLIEIRAANRKRSDVYDKTIAALKKELTDVEEDHAPPPEKVRDAIMVGIKPINKEIDDLADAIGDMRLKGRRLEDEATAIGAGECPTCKRPHDNAGELLARAARVKTKRAKIEQEILAARTKIKDLRTQVEVIRERATHAYTKAVTERASRRTEAVIKDHLKRVTNEAATDHENFTKAHNRLVTQRDAKAKLTKESRKKIEDFRYANASNLVLLKALAIQIEQGESQLQTLTKVKYALGRKGFRGEVLDQVTPYLNARTQKYLSALTDDNISAVWNTITENSDGDYVENFHIKVDHKSGVDKFGLLSGGEKRKVRLACALALQDLVATRAVKPIKLFIADEIDDAIDGAGLERLMGILETKAKEVGTVYVISHNEIGDWVRNKLTITKRDGVSAIT